MDCTTGKFIQIAVASGDVSVPDLILALDENGVIWEYNAYEGEWTVLPGRRINDEV